MKYYIYDETGEIMRIVHRQEEAWAICALRLGWKFKGVRHSVRVDLSQFEMALI
jgi:hypothetical protein